MIWPTGYVKNLVWGAARYQCDGGIIALKIILENPLAGGRLVDE
ncbi:MAG TPA: hypothetical protein VIM41_16465 [Gammaproteobacteria bacterium]